MEKPEGIDKIIEADPLQKYGLKFAGMGAEKICFETIGSTKKLIKVNIHDLRHKVLELLDNKESKEISITDSEEEKIESDMEVEKELAEFFGKEHVVKKSVFRFSVPITKDVALAVLTEEEKFLTDNMSDSEVNEVEMLIEAQPIAEELRDREGYKTLSLNTFLLTRDNFFGSKDVPDALKKIETGIENRFKDGSAHWIDKNGYSGIFKEVLEKLIQYTKKTGLMLDIFGPDNVTLFTDKDGEPNFHLLDAGLPGRHGYWNQNIKDDKNLGLLRHSYTFFYTINYLAKRLNIDSTLELNDMTYFKNAEIPSGKFPKKT